MKITIARMGQVLSKLVFCMRVAGNPGTFLRLLAQTRKLAHYQETGNSRGDEEAGYGRTAEALAYSIRVYSIRRTIYLRTYAGDIRMFYEIFWEEAYRLPPTLLKDPMVIVDAGANIGMTALYFSILYPGARIFCIEPDADNFQLLKENLTADRGRFVLTEAALYDRDGRVGLVRERWAYNSRIDEGEGAIEAIKMSSFLDRYHLERIDLLKIDVEGAEDKLFGGGLEWLAKVGVILIEVHSPEGVEPIGRKFLENGFSWRPWGREGGDDSLYLASKMEMTRLAKE